jgi:hypothetical protein
VDSDPVCFEYSRPQTVKFEYAINCTFDDHLDPLAVKSQEFDYFLRTNKVTRHTRTTARTRA